jgi:hypothetical protein
VEHKVHEIFLPTRAQGLWFGARVPCRDTLSGDTSGLNCNLTTTDKSEAEFLAWHFPVLARARTALLHLQRCISAEDTKNKQRGTSQNDTLRAPCMSNHQWFLPFQLGNSLPRQLPKPRLEWLRGAWLKSGKVISYMVGALHVSCASANCIPDVHGCIHLHLCHISLRDDPIADRWLNA